MTTIVFPGQGSQFIGMSKDFYDNFKVSKQTFDEIEDITKIKIKNIVFLNSLDLLNLTEYTQLSIYAASMSIFNVLNSEIGLDLLNVNFMLGHSLGEFSALTAANIINLRDCSNLLKIRGKLMGNACEPNTSGMAAIIGLNCFEVDKIIYEKGLSIEIANDNSPMQVVISGKKKDIENSENFFTNNGAKKFIPLNVSSAFHSKIMNNSQEQFNNHINKVSFQDSSFQIISNYSAKKSNKGDELKKNLSNQMSNMVRWTESIKLLEVNNEKTILEIGPGRVLSGLIKRISNNFSIINLEKIEDLDKVKNAFKS